MAVVFSRIATCRPMVPSPNLLPMLPFRPLTLTLSLTPSSTCSSFSLSSPSGNCLKKNGIFKDQKLSKLLVHSLKKYESSSIFFGEFYDCIRGDLWDSGLAFSFQNHRTKNLSHSFSTSTIFSRQNQQEELWPPNETPMRRRKRFGQAVEKMKKDSKKMIKLVQKGKIFPPPGPPQNGLLVESLIPVAYQTLEARTTVREGVRRLLKDYPAFACSSCPEIFIGSSGHKIRSCTGKDMHLRGGRHIWIPASLEDILSEVESYHLHDRNFSVIHHDIRMKVDRLPAVVELCIQAGVDLEGYEVVRRKRAIGDGEREGGEYRRFSQKKEKYLEGQKEWSLEERLREEMWVGMEENNERKERSEREEETEGERQGSIGTLSQGRDLEKSISLGVSGQRERERESGDELLLSLPTIGEDPDLSRVARRTLEAFKRLREGVGMLMKKYEVKACGYCPEVHVGPKGHKVRRCDMAKHQWRHGQHGWQEAILDDILPPKYVYHVRDRDNACLIHELRPFYGMAPAVVEMCVQAGAEIPREYLPLMRCDVVIPDVEELERVF